MRSLSIPLLLTFFVCTCALAQSPSPPERYRQLLDTTQSDSLRLDAYVQLTGYYIGQRDSAAVDRHLDTLGQLAKAYGDPFSRGRHQYMVAQHHNRRQEWTAGLAAADRALAHFEAANDPLQIFNAHWLAGLQNMRMGKREEALRRYLDGLTFARAAGSDRALFQSLNEIGNTHRRSGNLEQAEPYYLEALAVSQRLGSLRQEVATTTNLAILRKNQERYGEARDLYDRVLALAAKMNEPGRTIERGYAYVNLAELENKIDRPGPALTAARAALRAFEQHGSPREQSAALIELGTASGKLKRYAAAEDYFRRARTVGTRYPGLVRAGTQGLIGVFKEAGPLDSAVVYLERAADQVKADAENNRIEAIAEMEARFQTQEKQTEIDRLALADELNQTRLNQQRYLLYGGLTLLGLLSAFLYSLWQQRRRISHQNEMIATSLHEKETLLKEIHHRVKNNLQMVSSLLSLQGEFIEDSAALDAIEMSRQRVRSMSIIHQRLYLRDEVSPLVSAREYLGQLTGELLSTLNVSGQAIRLEKTIDNIDLDIDRLIPLGLVANELITNALKHAFTDREAGRLEVSFQRQGADLVFSVADDGHGSPTELTGRPDSFGNLLIRTFAEQLEGELTVDRKNGTSVILRFPAAEKALTAAR